MPQGFVSKTCVLSDRKIQVRNRQNPPPAFSRKKTKWRKSASHHVRKLPEASGSSPGGPRGEVLLGKFRFWPKHVFFRISNDFWVQVGSPNALKFYLKQTWGHLEGLFAKHLEKVLLGVKIQSRQNRKIWQKRWRVVQNHTFRILALTLQKQHQVLSCWWDFRRQNRSKIAKIYFRKQYKKSFKF